MYTVNNSEQLRELSCNDLSFLDNDPLSHGDDDDEEDELETDERDENGRSLGGNRRVCSNSTVKDLEKILDKFEADTQILLDDPSQLLNCKYTQQPNFSHWHKKPLDSFFAHTFRAFSSLILCQRTRKTTIFVHVYFLQADSNEQSTSCVRF